MESLIIYENVCIDGVWQDVLQSKLIRKVTGQNEDGNDVLGDTYKHYNADMTPNEIAEAEYLEPNKDIKLQALYVDVNGVRYDAHKEAIENMNAVVNTANAEMFALMAQGMIASDAYNQVFKTEIQWKNYYNLTSNVQVESIKEALKKAIEARALIYGV